MKRRTENTNTKQDDTVCRMTNRMRAGDLFAGAGGLSVGFHDAGYDSVFFNEIDPIASQTYLSNFPKAVSFQCPIQELTAKIIKEETGAGEGDLDVMIGGPPCQGFSINAPLRSANDLRNHLFRQYARLVLEGIRPKFIVLENVPGLVSMDNGETYGDVIKAFEEAGYKVEGKILNAAHYGVPQERWRLFFIGTRLPGVSPSFPEPVYYSLQRPNFTGGRSYTFLHAIGNQQQVELFNHGLLPPITVGEAISDLPEIDSGGGDMEMMYILPPENDYQLKLRGKSKILFNHVCSDMAKINKKRFEHVIPGGSWRDIPFELLPKGLQKARRSDHTKRYGRLDPGSLSGTIMTKCDPHWGTFVHYSQDRIISVREAARIQSFPDWFVFKGSRIDQYRQVGNAVPPLMAQEIANHIKNLIQEAEQLPEREMYGQGSR